MDRIFYSIGAAVVVGLLLYFTVVLFALTGAIVPIWVLPLLILVIFIGLLIFDIVTTAPEKPPARSPDEE